MEITIQEQFLRKATACKNDRRCVNGASMFPVEDPVGATALVVTPPNGADCDYLTRLDTTVYCTCPVRIQIYKKYGV